MQEKNERYKNYLNIIKVTYPEMKHLQIEEYNQIAKEINSGNKKAVEKLYSRILPSINYAARVFSCTDLEEEFFPDFINEVSITLMERYKSKAKGPWFSNYFSFNTTNHFIVDSILKQFVQDFSKKTIIKELYSKNEIEVERCRLDEINETLPENSNEFFDQFFKEMFASLFIEVVDCLTPREKKFISLWFGLNCAPRSLMDIAHMEHISRNAVHQIILKAIEKLRHPTKTKQLCDFCDFIITGT